MNEHRYFDQFHADGYYLSDHQKERQASKRPSLRDHPSCPACYRPVKTAGYCGHCEASGAAERHQTRTLIVRVAAVRAKKQAPVEPTPRPRLTLDERRGRFVYALQQAAVEMGRTPTCYRWQHDGRRPVHHEAWTLFGSWRGALQAAGLVEADVA